MLARRHVGAERVANRIPSNFGAITAGAIDPVGPAISDADNVDANALPVGRINRLAVGVGGSRNTDSNLGTDHRKSQPDCAACAAERDWMTINYSEHVAAGPVDCGTSAGWHACRQTCCDANCNTPVPTTSPSTLPTALPTRTDRSSAAPDEGSDDSSLEMVLIVGGGASCLCLAAAAQFCCTLAAESQKPRWSASTSKRSLSHHCTKTRC